MTTALLTVFTGQGFRHLGSRYDPLSGEGLVSTAGGSTRREASSSYLSARAACAQSQS
ncbi:hypothetical protein [Ferrithrix thermotolerans]|uniref:hypothetical protein n=1 Tax=Ferrithrix thermotolerans TaxID=209649 RepID=UPI0015BE9AEC|nr:hypothetical protein [Ferrithrix thermotolerans]